MAPLKQGKPPTAAACLLPRVDIEIATMSSSQQAVTTPNGCTTCLPPPQADLVKLQEQLRALEGRQARVGAVAASELEAALASVGPGCEQHTVTVIGSAKPSNPQGSQRFMGLIMIWALMGDRGCGG